MEKLRPLAVFVSLVALMAYGLGGVLLSVQAHPLHQVEWLAGGVIAIAICSGILFMNEFFIK